MPPWSQTTTQIGGDVVYREGGKVHDGLETVGTSVYGGTWGVLSRSLRIPAQGAGGQLRQQQSSGTLGVFT